MVKFRYMMVFLQVAESGSISSAAEVLGISKSVVSQQLKSLETSLGVSLLNRTTRTQIITPAGRDFLHHCQNIRRISDTAWTQARDSQLLAVGSISISAPHALINTLIAPALGELLKQHPGITPKLQVNDSRIDLIETGFDLAIRVGKMPDSNFKQRRLGQFQEILCAHKSYVEVHEISQNKLMTDQTYRYSCDYISSQWQGSVIKHQVIGSDEKHSQTLDFRPNRTADSLLAVHGLTEAGCGLAWLPKFIVANSPTANQVINVLSDYHSKPVNIYAVHAFGQHCPFIVKLCIEAIHKKMQVL